MEQVLPTNRVNKGTGIDKQAYQALIQLSYSSFALSASIKNKKLALGSKHSVVDIKKLPSKLARGMRASR